jgi:hypothetical protein
MVKMYLLCDNHGHKMGYQKKGKNGKMVIAKVIHDGL